MERRKDRCDHSLVVIENGEVKVVELKKRRLGIAVCYDKDGIIDDYIPYCLKDLKENLDKLIVVFNGQLSKAGFDKLASVADDVVERDNHGMDFGAWKYAICQYLGQDEICSYDELVLLNDTFYGPFYSFQTVFDKMSEKEVDFWGITDHGQAPGPSNWPDNEYGCIPRHIQTYFLVFREKLLRSDAFKDFWENVEEFDEFEYTVMKIETVLSRHFEDLGYRWDVYAKDNSGGQSYNACKYNTYELIRNGLPILKRKYLSSRYPNYGENLNEVQSRSLEYVKKNSSYPIKLMFDNMLRLYNGMDIFESLNLNFIVHEHGGYKEIPRGKSAAVFLHISYTDDIDEKMRYIQNIPQAVDVYINTTSEYARNLYEKRLSEEIDNNFQVIVSPDKGGDSAALLIAFKDYTKKYDYFCFCHDKRLPQAEYWKGHSYESLLWECLLSSQEYILEILNMLDKDPSLGILTVPYFTAGFQYITNTKSGNFWTMNYENTGEVLKKLEIEVPLSEDRQPLTIGTAFWCKSDALRPLLEYDWKYEYFDDEPLPVDGALSHAVERSFSYVAQSKLYYTAMVMTDEYAGIFSNYYLTEIQSVKAIENEAANEANNEAANKTANEVVIETGVRNAAAVLREAIKVKIRKLMQGKANKQV